MFAWPWMRTRRQQDDIHRNHSSHLAHGPGVNPTAPDASTEDGDSPQRLPVELLIQILSLAILERHQDSIELSLFGRLRLVAKPVKDLVEQAFPRTLSRYAARVLRDLLHGSSERSIAEVASLALASAPLFQQTRQLAVWYTRDAVEALNRVLPHLTRLEELAIYVSSGDTRLESVNLHLCRELRSLHIDVLRPGCGVSKDVHLSKRVQPPPLVNPTSSATRAGRRIDRLRVGPIMQPHLMLLQSLAFLTSPHLDSFDMSDCFLDVAAVNALLLFLPYGPASMNLRNCQVKGIAVIELNLGTKKKLRMLILRDNVIKNPGVLSLSSNASLQFVDLAFNALNSAALGLDANHSLRHLDLTGCFRHCSSETERGSRLREIAQQPASNATLECLILAENGITDMAARELTLGHNGGLKTLSLADNQLSAAGVAAVLAGNAALEEVDLRGNMGVTEQHARELSTEGARRIVF